MGSQPEPSSTFQWLLQCSRNDNGVLNCIVHLVFSINVMFCFDRGDIVDFPILSNMTASARYSTCRFTDCHTTHVYPHCAGLLLWFKLHPQLLLSNRCKARSILFWTWEQWVCNVGSHFDVLSSCLPTDYKQALADFIQVSVMVELFVFSVNSGAVCLAGFWSNSHSTSVCVWGILLPVLGLWWYWRNGDKQRDVALLVNSIHWLSNFSRR